VGSAFWMRPLRLALQYRPHSARQRQPTNFLLGSFTVNLEKVAHVPTCAWMTRYC
jgi:hypothetical protein